MDRSRFLPVSKADMAARGIEQLDFVYISGDAYVDHPSFGTAIIARVLEASGFSVGIIAQPDWRDPASISALGEPRLGFLVSATWIRWSTTIPSPKSAAARTPSRRAEKWGCAPITPRSSTPT